MLRLLVLALVLANAVYLVWAQGLLTAYGFGPVIQAEPERLGQQINPEAIQLLEVNVIRPSPRSFTVAPPPKPAASAPARAASAPAAPSPAPPASTPGVLQPVRLAVAPPAAPVCLQAGLFTERQANAMRPYLQARLAAGSWKFENTAEPVRWIVYMGKYINKDALNRKRALLEQKGVPFQMASGQFFAPGLILGSYRTKADAQAAQNKLSERGIRSARVVAERPEVPSLRLKLPAVDAAQQARVKPFVAQLSGRQLQSCS
jgi:hypothetical protein